MNLDRFVSPHIRKNISVENVMWTVVLALLPIAAFSVYDFGINAFFILAASITSALLTEVLLTKSLSIKDGSAFITGLLLGLTLPPTVPYWLPAIGGFVAISIGKIAFGGLGANIFNPALVGRSFLTVSWPVLMTTWVMDGITAATPLAIAKKGGELASYKSLFLGNIAGSIGETSALLILICGLFLIFKGIISWITPFFYISTVFVFSFLIGKDPLFHILAGGLFIGAFFMATDYVTSPVTWKGKIIFAIGCGLLTVTIRLFSGLSGGVSFSILLMNSITPLIDRYTKPKRFGIR